MSKRWGSKFSVEVEESVDVDVCIDVDLLDCYNSMDENDQVDFLKEVLGDKPWLDSDSIEFVVDQLNKKIANISASDKHILLMNLSTESKKFFFEEIIS